MAKMRLTYYAIASFVAAGGVIVKAFNDRPNFYSAAVYLAQTPLCYMILANFALLCFGSIVYTLQKLMFGELRIIERERLWERGWLSVMETLLIMMTFRDDVGGWFFSILANLVVARLWAWIAEGRIEMLEQQPPTNPRLFHTRLSSSLVISFLFNFFFLRYCVNTVLEEAKPGMMVMFAFEFAVLTITSFSNLLRYGISLNEIRVVGQQTKERLEARRAEIRAQREQAQAQATAEGSTETGAILADLPREEDVDENEIDVPGWEEKGRWVFALDIVTDFFRLVIYLAFFSVLMIFSGIPIHIVRDVYVTLHSFLKRIWSFYQYSNATKDMNTRYPDATAEELERENTCIVCREEMRPWPQDGSSTMEQRLRPKKLPCGHILHFGCLRSWLERQQVCPTCRRPVLGTERFTASAADRRAGRGQDPGAQNAQDVQRHRPAPGVAQPAHNRGPNDHAGPDQGQNPLAQWRPRVFNLGPVRIAFGTMPATALNMLQRGQINTGETPESQANTPTMLSDPLNMVNTSQNPASMGFELMQMEREISRQIMELNITQQQLGLVRALQSELARLRSVHGMTQVTYQTTPTDAIPQVATEAGPSSSARSLAGLQNQLPPGMTLPEGWTILPLTRTDAAGPAPPSAPSMAQRMPAQEESQHPSVSTAPVHSPQPTPTVPFSSLLNPGLGPQREAASEADEGTSHALSTHTGASTTPVDDQTRSGHASTSDARDTVRPTWSFGDAAPSDSVTDRKFPAANGATTSSASQLSDQRAEHGSANGTAEKGKGKAVTVEDEPDE